MAKQKASFFKLFRKTIDPGTRRPEFCSLSHIKLSFCITAISALLNLQSQLHNSVDLWDLNRVSILIQWEILV